MTKEVSLKDKFDTRKTVAKLDNLMDKVTEKECTPATVQAAVNCANTIVDILRLHLEVERLSVKKRNI